MSRVRDRPVYRDVSDLTVRYSYWDMGSWAPAQTFDGGIKPAFMEYEWMEDLTHGALRPRASYLNHWKTKRTMVGPHWDTYDSIIYRRSPYETMQRLPLGLPQHAPLSTGFGYGFQDELFNEAVEDSTLMQQAQGLPFIAEMRQAIQMVRNPLNFLKHVRVPRRHRNKTLGDLAALKRSASDGYLTTKYGWKPLIQDLYAFSNIVSGLSGNYARYRMLASHGYSGRVTKQTAESASTNPVLPTGNTSAFVTRTTTKGVLSGTLWYNLRPSGEVMSKSDYLLKSLGLTPGEIITTAWELVPYSFVVDWFIPVGNTLQRITHTPANFAVQDTCYVLSYDSESQHFKFSSMNSGTPWAPPPTSRVEKVANDVSRQTFRGGEGVLPHSTLPWFQSIQVVAALALIEQKLRLPVP